MKVKEIMTTPVVSAGPDTPTRDVAQLLTRHRISGVPVTDRDGAVVGLVKVVAERDGGRVLGVHVIGPSASDLIPEGVLAMQLEATLTDIADTIHAHPTLGEGTMEAAMVALGLPVHVPPPRRR